MDKTRRVMNKTSAWWIFVITSVIGIVNGLYLTLLKLTNNKNLCIQGLGDCWSVNTSKYSQILGIPVALLGTLAFLSILLIFVLEEKIGFLRDYSKYLLFGLSLVGVLFSAYLTYIELAVIQAICPFCVLSALAMAVLFALSVIRLVKSQP